MKRRSLGKALLLGALVLAWGSGAGLAQTATVRGKVTDAKTQQPLPGANVVLKPVSGEGRSFGAASGHDGFFAIKNIAPGAYRLTVTYIGYKTYELRRLEIAGGKSTSIPIALEPTAIMAGAISVTASRRPEKALEAPASVSILESDQIQARSAFTPVDHIKGLPGVDVASSGLVSSNVTVRGFNDIFSTTLMVLTDNRIARVPNLRVNAYSMIPTTNEDIERIEIVSGPGSALYGPNAANGVMHIITKSPFGSEGTTVSFANGERSVFLGSFRHASSFNNKLGLKITGQYYEGNDWEYVDPKEPAKIVKGRQTASGRFAVGDSVENHRDAGVEKFSLEGRVDYRFNDDAMLIVNGAVNSIDEIELTSIGSAQAIDWMYTYAQARFTYKDLFAQAFINRSDAGETFLLRTGDLIEDNSMLMVGQVQHAYAPSARQRFTYGFDALFTRPDTKGTINGRNEDDDDINEYGGYVQSETTLSPKLDLLVAGRLDYHSRLEGVQFSPRAALVFKPTPAHNLRATFNRAFRTPENNALFLDILSVPDAFELGTLLEPVLGFRPATDIRAQGVPETGFHFSRSANGLPQFRSPFAPLTGKPNSHYFDMNDPAFLNEVWGVARIAVFEGLQEEFRTALLEQGFNEDFINSLFAAFESDILPKQVDGVKNTLMMLDPDSDAEFPFFPATDVADIPRQKPTITETYELGYKGVLANKLVLGIDLYYTKLTDFGGPILVETPNVFFDQATLAQSLQQQFEQNFNASTNFLLRGILLQLDDPANDGNGNGTPVDELTQIFSENAAQIPLGTVTPKEALDPTAVLLTYRNFGDIDVWGADLQFMYYLNDTWSFGANYSYVSKDFFPKTSGQPLDIALNAPKNKAGATLQYRNTHLGLSAQARLRWVDGFPVAAGVFTGDIAAYTLLDVTLGYQLADHTRLALTVQNLFNEKHREMIGAPELGRLAMLRFTQSF